METVTSNHCQDIMLRLDNDRKASAKYCDITLVVGDHKFPAHKSVLGLLSTFFDKMFHIDMKEKRRNEAEIKGVSKEVLEVILDFIYTGNMALSMENVFAVIEAAHFMDLPYVQETCTKYLSNQVNAGNWLSIRAYAKRYEYKELLDKVDEAVALKFDVIIQSDQFVELDIEELKHLLGLQSRKVYSEDEVYKAVIGWIKHDLIGRENSTENLLSFVNFAKLTLGLLKRVVSKEKLIENSFSCTRAVLNAISNHPGTDNQIAVVSPINSFVAVDDVSFFKYDCGDVQKQLLSHNHRGGSAVKHGSCVYVIGGFNTKEIEEVTINNMQVEESGSSSQCRYGAASVVENNRLYVTGGLHTETSAEGGSWNYNRHGWYLSLLSHMNFDRHSHALVSMMGSIYLVGGNTSVDQTLLRFDLQTNKVKLLSSMSFTQIGLAAVILNDTIYAIAGKRSGGKRSQYDSSSVTKYDLLTNVWEPVANLKVGRFRPGACVIHNQIVVAGGGSGKIEVYDERLNRWNIVGECEDLKNVFAIFSS